MTDQTRDELIELKRLERDYDLSATTVMVIQTHMVVRDFLRGMTPEHAAEMRDIDLKGILARSNVKLPKWDPLAGNDESEPIEGGWRDIPGWTRTRKPKSQDRTEDEPAFQ